MKQPKAPSFVDIFRLAEQAHGELTIKSTDRQGNVHIYQTPNVIVFNARPTLAHLLAGDDVSNRRMGYIGVGLNNTAPARTDTALLQPVLNQIIDQVSYPNGDTGQVEFSATLDFVSAANGSTLREAGLFSANGTSLFARQIHGGIEKDTSIQLQYLWRIIFT